MATLLLIGELNLTESQTSRISELGLTIQKNASAEDIVADSFDFAIVLNDNINRYISKFISCQLVVMAETGFANCDIELAKRFGVNVTNIVGYSTEAVAEYVLSILFDCLRPWHHVFDFNTQLPRTERIGSSLCGKTVGFLGFGDIGQMISSSITQLGPRIIFNTRRPFRHRHAVWVSFDSLLCQSDILIICCSLNQSSFQLFGKTQFERLKEDAILISISPNRVFNLDELFKFLAYHPRIQAFLDFDQDEHACRLSSLKNAKISPHIAFYTKQAVEKRIDSAIDRIERYIQGLDWEPASGPHPINKTIRFISAHNLDDARDTILNLGSSFYQSASLFAALELQVFDVLDNSCMSYVDLAGLLGANIEFTQALLYALSSTGLIEMQSNERFRVVPRFLPFLKTDSPYYYGNTILALQENIYTAWLKLARVVRDGNPLVPIQQFRKDDLTSAINMTKASDGQSSYIADLCLPFIDCQNISSVLDLGCGSASLARAIIKVKPTVNATFLDVPHVIQCLKNYYLCESDNPEKYDYISGDILDDFPVGKLFDCIIVSNILHMLHSHHQETLLKKCTNTLSTRGILVLIGFFLDPENQIDSLSSHFSLSCKLLSDNGGSPTTEKIHQLLYGIGLHNIKHIFLTSHVDLLVCSKNLLLK